MKRLCLLGLTIIGMIVASCSLNQVDEPLVLIGKTIPVSITAKQADGNETKTIRNADKSVSWMPAEDILVICGEDRAKFTSTNTDNSPTATFLGELNKETIEAVNNGTTAFGVLGLYPYNEYAEGWVAYGYYDNAEHCFISTTLPNVQTGIAGTFADDLFITVAKSDNFNLFFYNVCSGFKFSITKEGISSITLKGRNDECIAGDVELTFDDDGKSIIVSGPSETSITLTPEGRTFEVGKDYYIVMFPTLFSNGFTVSFETSNERAVLVIPKSVNFPRSKFVTKSNADANLTYQPYTPDGNINIPDANFKSYCVANFDRNNDGELSYLEALDINTIYCSSMNISSLEGIEYFNCLTELDCSHNSLTSLDTRNNSMLKSLYCGDNNLSSLTVSFNSFLNELACDKNQLTSLDVSGCSALTILGCSSNQLTNLNVSGCTALTELSCDNNQLTSLDVSSCSALTILGCSSNQLTNLNVSGCTALTELHCYNNQLARFNVNGCSSLEYLGCSNNQLTNLNVSDCTQLIFLYCEDNQLTSLDVSGCSSLEYLECSNNKLTILDASSCEALNTIYLRNNPLTSIDISGCASLQTFGGNCTSLTSLNARDCKKLTSLQCQENQLIHLDVRGCSSMVTLTCWKNKLTSLDVSGCTALTELWCENNQLKSLDVSGCTALTVLLCDGNQLSSLDVSNNSLLTRLLCNNNPSLLELWLKTGQTINSLQYDATVTTIKYKD